MTVINMLFYTIIIPMCIIIIGLSIHKRYKLSTSHVMLVAAALLFSAALFVPSPLIENRDTQFVTHMLGGVFIGLMWLYLRELFPRNIRWYGEFATLFVLASVFGVLNELYELFAYKTGLTNMPVDDASWDLTANTLGIGGFYGVYRLVKSVRTLFRND